MATISHGRLTANGEVFDMGSLTAAHPTLPMPSYARVTNLSNGRSLIVRVNDRGPYHGNRLIDVSNKAAELLDFKGNGVARVRVEYVGRAPLEGSDDRQLMATLRTGTPAPSPSMVRVASARPFVPEMSSSSGRVRGDVPLPEGRPYSLGNTQADYASVSATSEMSASSRSHRRAQNNPREVSYESDAALRGEPDARRDRLCPDRCARAGRGPERARPVLDQPVQDQILGLIISRNAINAALTSSGRSCWIQWPAPSMISFCRRFGSTRSMSATCLAPISPVITESFEPAMNSEG